MDKRVEVIISAMHQKDLSIIDATHIQSDALLINQCDEDSYVEENREYGKIRCISTIERGLSRSRNMAISNAIGDYCLICDDDELLYSGYVEKIIDAFEQHQDADIICFKIKIEGKKYSNREMRIGFLRSLRISSCQIVLKPKSILRNGIKFDTNFGSGTSIGSGEENIFLFDCLKKGMKIYYIPICLGIINQKESQWFHGFTKQYFLNRGIIIRRLMGRFLGCFYCLYFAINKYKKYRGSLSFFTVIYLLYKGLNTKIF